MIIISLSDIHGNVSYIQKMAHLLSSADMVILSGDITNFGHESELNAVLNSTSRYNSNILAVHGNCDYPAVEHELSQKGINLHGTFRKINGLGFFGLGGSLETPFRTPCEVPDHVFKRHLQQAETDMSPGMPFIVVSHQPPADTTCDRLSNGTHVGSPSLRAFIATHQPLVCFTGHIHEAYGIDTIGHSVIINPGVFGEGRYAFVRLARAGAAYTLEEYSIKTI